jgi:hypothetical protein
LQKLFFGRFVHSVSASKKFQVKFVEVPVWSNRRLHLLEEEVGKAHQVPVEGCVARVLQQKSHDVVVWFDLRISEFFGEYECFLRSLMVVRV